ncbi:glutamyl-tRNA amidotransferase subunit A [Natrialba chahannaoensis JCM 10990]|uniref:Glutamyl-tRNA amidotransferase subunit A n=1 Tax=Natrialba chahannaoensis JCM 10990 TaxID=1227492 RepID=M0AC58_9EURY|nr:amidase [Natrialba chahannaoensis]ELY96109.1 glutamyl-tRNA amidotransferase subunit A [Natrialba chahannaoensis JCM 10990]
MNVSFISAADIARHVRQGELSPVQVVEEFIERIDCRDSDLNAFAEVAADRALDRATRIEDAIEQGSPVGPLAGVPVALKESAASKAGFSRTMGIEPFRESVSETDSTFVERLEAAGAIVIGTTNTPELDHKGITDNPLRGPTRNPFDLTRNAGGSSGGSAAAVADGLVPIAHGKDAGGSLRIPAAWSGVYALKPTFRRVPETTRPDAFADELGIRSSHGPITRTVRDAALFLDVVAGSHPRDPASLPDMDTSFSRATTRSIEGMRIAYTPDYGTFPVRDDVEQTVADAAQTLECAGAVVEEVSISTGYSHDELTEIWLDLVGANLAALNEWLTEHDDIDLIGDHRDQVSDGLVDLIESGKGTSATEYLHANVVRTAVHDTLVDLFDEYDLLVSPTVCHPSVKNVSDGETLGPERVNGELVDPRIGWCPTYLLNFTGHPAASLPAGTVADGLPVGMQIAGPRFGEGDIIAASAAFERLEPWSDWYPPR